MTNAVRLLGACFIYAALSLADQVRAGAENLKLPAIISDHMVLQSGQEDPLWGWAAAGTPILAEFVDASGKTLAQANATTSSDGKWSLKLAPLAPDAAGTIRITAGATVKTIQDVVVGESWLCTGQSNMVYDFSAKNIPPDILATAKQEATDAHGAIHVFLTQNASAPTSQDDSKGNWFVVTPDNLARVSCVAWNFAVALREKVDRPVGLVVCCVGGTPAERWMSAAALASFPAGADLEEKAQKAAIAAAPRLKQWQEDDAAWIKANPTPELQAQNKATRPKRNFLDPAKVCDLYNGMFHGLEPYGVKGVLWFQADGNLSTVSIYGGLIKALITSWRADWQEELPFYYVEMNGMRDKEQDLPVKLNQLSLLREKQADALVLPKVDVVCAIDCAVPSGEPHFPKKKPVGQRLALLALDHDYNLPCECHSPTYTSFAVEGNKIRVHFDHAAGLRARDGGDIAGFAIRGATGDWVWAKGQVDGQDMLLWNDQIPQPTAARYAWAPNPVTSMENGAGIPMRPFRTDTTSPQ